MLGESGKAEMLGKMGWAEISCVTEHRESEMRIDISVTSRGPLIQGPDRAGPGPPNPTDTL